MDEEEMNKAIRRGESTTLLHSSEGGVDYYWDDEYTIRVETDEDTIYLSTGDMAKAISEHSRILAELL